MSDSKKIENLKKMTLIELRDTLYRESQLLKNSKLVNKLPDKGESIKRFREKVQAEINYREELENIEKSISELSIGEKHVRKLCEIERTPEKDRYKPFSTLTRSKEVNPNSKVLKIIEDCTHTQKPTKLINLAESIEILKQQDEKVKEEQMKARHKRLLERLEKSEESEASNSESEGCHPDSESDNEDRH